MEDRRRRLKPFLQVALDAAFILIYIWVIDPNPHLSYIVKNLFLWGLCVGFPIACIAIEQSAFPEFSLDWSSFVASARLLVWFTLAATILLVGIALANHSLNYDNQFW